MSAVVGEPKDETSFNWSPELITHFLESFITDNGRVLFQPRNGGFLEPLKRFTCYLQFCKRAFNGTPPKECPIEVYEKMLDEAFPPAWNLFYSAAYDDSTFSKEVVGSEKQAEPM